MRPPRRRKCIILVRRGIICRLALFAAPRTHLSDYLSRALSRVAVINGGIELFHLNWTLNLLLDPPRTDNSISQHLGFVR